MKVPRTTPAEASAGTLQVFLSYRGSERPQVAAFRDVLARHGVSCFYDRESLVVGLPWPDAIEQALAAVDAVLVFVGADRDGELLGHWQRRECWFALDRQAEAEQRGELFPVIPVLLPGSCPDTSLLFLNTWIDLRRDPQPDQVVHAVLRAIDPSSHGEPIRKPFRDPSTVCPFRALEAFREEHAGLFFGRDRAAEALVQRVHASPFVALVGSSGSGKSSLVEAGLVPRLRRQRPPRSSWDVALFTPGERPFDRLGAALAPWLERDADEITRLENGRRLGQKLARGAIRVRDVIERGIHKSNGTDRLLLVIDQLEELFTLSHDEERAPFLRAILDALGSAQLRVLVTLRADFYGHAISFDRRLSELLQAGIENLGPLTRDELRETIEQPAAQSGLRLEPGLVTRMLDRALHQPGSLPLLQFALTQLWGRREGERLTHAAYEAIGELSGAIVASADRVFDGLDPEQRRVAARLFTRLVRVAAVDEPALDTRRRLDLDGLSAEEHTVIQPFVEARLLVLGSARNGPAPRTLELAHEALIHEWPQLGAWLREQRACLLWRQQLAQRMEDWRNSHHDGGLLLRGQALLDAVRWVATQPDLDDVELDFVRKSATRARARRRNRWIAVSMIIGLIGSIPLLRLAVSSGLVVTWLALHPWETISDVHSERTTLSDWVWTVKTAGLVDALDSEFLDFRAPFDRAAVLRAAARVLANTEERAAAQRFLLRAIALHPPVGASHHFDIADIAISAGLRELGAQHARLGLRVGRASPVREERAFDAVFAAQKFAALGLREEAEFALAEARSLESDVSPRERENFLAWSASTLWRLDQDAEARALIQALPLPLPWWLVQDLLDAGELALAAERATAGADGVALAMVASASLGAGDERAARRYTESALELIERGDLAAGQRDSQRMGIYERLLLHVASEDEAVALVRARENPDELATFAHALAANGHARKGCELAAELVPLAATVSPTSSQDPLRRKLISTQSLCGQSERALALVASIQDLAMQADCLAIVARGFAEEGREARADALLQDAVQRAASIVDPASRARAWTGIGIAQISRHRYDQLLEPALANLDNDTYLYLLSLVLRDRAVQKDPGLREIFERPRTGLGRPGVDF